MTNQRVGPATQNERKRLENNDKMSKTEKTWHAGEQIEAEATYIPGRPTSRP